MSAAPNQKSVPSAGLHTAGPWTYEEEKSSGPVLTKACIFAHGDVIGQAYEDRYLGNCQANARLMAAAPDLLRELEDITARFERCCIASGSPAKYAASACRNARAAIAKACGQ